MIRVAMFPHVDDLQPDPTAGISRVVKNYFRYLPDYGIQMAKTKSDAVDLVAIHAGAVSDIPLDLPIVSHCHGLYFTGDSKMEIWTHGVNQTVIDIVRHASRVTVPSQWVAEIFRRDMHFDPVVVPHGVEWDEWQGGGNEGYVLWNKNRASDACDPMPVNELAMRAPKTRILSTYAAPNPRPNIRVTGTVDYATMRDMILNCAIYLATTKETFGIGTLEAMAAGKPILGFDYGGTSDLVKHGYSGYLAAPGDYDDLARGLEYCTKHARVLGRNAALVAQSYTWAQAAKEVAREYERAMDLDRDNYDVTVVIPVYNKAATLLRAVRSVLAQTFKPVRLIIVNNNSTDDLGPVIQQIEQEAIAAGVYVNFRNCEAQGVAHARNLGIAYANTTLVCCLDADDEILPTFLERCRFPLIGNRGLGISYAGLEAVNQRGDRTVSAWPSAYNFDKTLRGQNQVPTCCVFRREAWQRAGGYRQRYAPTGAGSEDADLWLRIGLLGWGGIQATSEPLFRYYLGGAVSGNPDYREVDWRGDKGWIAEKELPFAATSTPENKMAHLVRQYDEPLISVIIPVGPGHSKTLIDAIDSVEAQIFRRWELIVVDDSVAENEEEYELWRRLFDAFPFVRFAYTTSSSGPASAYHGHIRQSAGAGAARNLGAKIAKAPLLLFLDADDWLKPTALSEMVAAWEQNEDRIVYSDYIGHAYITDKAVLERLRQAQRLLEYNEKTNQAAVIYHAYDFDCERAQRQPEQGKDPYIWNVISSLVPAEFHREIGGFDESMKSWEDWDYWVRLAKAGHCFYRVAKPLLEYRFFTGKRRSLANPYESGESGRQLSTHLLEYMRAKYERMENMPCSSCGGGRRSSPPPISMSMSARISGGDMSNITSDDMVEVELIDGNVGDHLIAFQGRSYNYRSHGDRFMMLASHARLDRRVRILEAKGTATAAKSTKRRETPPPPPASTLPDDIENEEEVPQTPPPVVTPPTASQTPASTDVTITSDDAYDLTQLWGINEERAALLGKMGVRTSTGVSLLSEAQVMKALDANESTARRIISEAAKTASQEKKNKAKAKK